MVQDVGSEVSAIDWVWLSVGIIIAVEYGCLVYMSKRDKW